MNRHVLLEHVALRQNLITYRTLEKFQFRLLFDFRNFIDMMCKNMSFESLPAVKLCPAVFTGPLVFGVGFPMMSHHTLTLERPTTEITNESVIRDMVFFMLLQG